MGNVYVNLLIVFIVTGFWHGASFNFLVWGLWHGVFLIIERVLKRNRKNHKQTSPPIRSVLRHVLTLLIVLVGWVLFRAEGLGEAWIYIRIMFGLLQPENVGFTAWYYIDLKVIITLAIAVTASIPVFRTWFFRRAKDTLVYQYASSIAVLLLFFISIVFVMSSSYNPFIYFRF